MEKLYTLTPEQIEGIRQHDLKRSQLVKEVHEEHKAKRKTKEDLWNKKKGEGYKKTK
jgi:hypothetical protein